MFCRNENRSYDYFLSRKGKKGKKGKSKSSSSSSGSKSKSSSSQSKSSSSSSSSSSETSSESSSSSEESVIGCNCLNRFGERGMEHSSPVGRGGIKFLTPREQFFPAWQVKVQNLPRAPKARGEEI